MNRIKILDCTLRDGGYINDWKFGEKSIKRIIQKLSKSNIDIIECGFIEGILFDKNKALFDNVERFKIYITPKNHNVLYVGMIAYPYIPVEKISDYDNTSIDGIRVTFHEEELEEALTYSKQLMDKGYKVFIQPVGTTSYSDSKLLELIDKVNTLKPYAFYMVDTLGIMYKNDLLRMFHLIDNNLNEQIIIGFHSHNNLQLSFSNAQELLMLHTKREIIIDSSVYGMGRGAGNLCTELITHYINENIEERYDTVPLLEIFDEHLSRISNEIKWGYSIPYYLAAINSCHPNYASHLMNKQTLSVKKINAILNLLPNPEKDLYNNKLIENLYINYQNQYVNDEVQRTLISSKLLNKKVLLIAPGKSIESQKDDIHNFIHNNQPFIFAVNFIPRDFKADAIFVSNLKRFKSICDIIEEESISSILITTSNITPPINYVSVVVNYSELLIEDYTISDNAGLMLINLLNQLSITEVFLAGFDGFSLDKSKNYYLEEMVNNVEKEELIKKNKAIIEYIKNLKKKMNIRFVTESTYDN